LWSIAFIISEFISFANKEYLYIHSKLAAPLYGVASVSDFKNLQYLEVCSGFITNAGVKNIKDLKAMRLLNLSQNGNLTDKTLELISGTYAL
jgi:hypothetical protein